MKTGVHHPSVVVILRIVPCDYCLKVSCKHYMPLLTTVDLFVKQRYQLTSIHNPHLQMGKIGSVFVVILENTSFDCNVLRYIHGNSDISCDSKNHAICTAVIFYYNVVELMPISVVLAI